MHNNIAETPAARGADPSTSHAAADAITRSGERGRQQHVVLTAVQMFPGSTSAELADLSTRYCWRLAYQAHGRKPTCDEADCCALDRWQIARRLSEVEASTRIHRGEARKCGIKGRKSLTWWPKAEGARHDG